MTPSSRPVEVVSVTTVADSVTNLRGRSTVAHSVRPGPYPCIACAATRVHDAKIQRTTFTTRRVICGRRSRGRCDCVRQHANGPMGSMMAAGTRYGYRAQRLALLGLCDVLHSRAESRHSHCSPAAGVEVDETSSPTNTPWSRRMSTSRVFQRSVELIRSPWPGRQSLFVPDASGGAERTGGHVSEVRHGTHSRTASERPEGRRAAGGGSRQVACVYLASSRSISRRSTVPIG